MSQSSRYFLHYAELRAAEEQGYKIERSARLAYDSRRRGEIHAEWQKAAEDQEREEAYRKSIANSKGEVEYNDFP